MEHYLPASRLTVLQLAHALEKKIHQTIKQEAAIPLPQLEHVSEVEAAVHSISLAVKSWKNTLSPVNRLPPEILTLIPTFLHNKRIQRLISWSQVCRYWRSTFTNTPTLWTHVTCKNLARTRISIEHSKPAPLRVRLFTHFCPQSFEVLAPYAQRFESLKMNVLASELHSHVVPNLKRPAPLLEQLVVETVYHEGDALVEAPLPLLFNGELPRLTRLILEGVSPHPTWFDISNLTTFHLIHTGSHGGSSSQLLHFFERNSGLEEVQIAYEARFADDTPPNHIVNLPRLRKLRLGDCPSKHGILHHLLLPAGVKVTLWLDMPELVCGIAASPPLWIQNPPNFLTGIDRISFLEDEDEICVHFTGPHGTLYIQVPYGKAHDLAARCIYTFDPLDVSEVTEFLIKNYSPKRREHKLVGDSAIHHCLRSLPKLKTLILVSCANATHFQALQLPNPDEDGYGIVCPGLEHLFIDVSHSRRPKDLPFSDLLSLAEKRKSLGHELKCVTLKSIHPLFEDSDLKLLQKSVVTLKTEEGKRSSLKWNSGGWVLPTSG